jgi:hypothetical protein
MDHLDCPDRVTWELRRAWFEDEVEQRIRGGHILDEQATALLADAQAAFCAGAWVAVVIVATSVIEAQLQSDAGRAPERFVVLEKGDEREPQLAALRRLRNRLVHAKPGAPTITVEMQWAERSRLEEEARAACVLMFEVLFRDAWV